MTIDLDSAEPLYEQLVAIIRRRIEDGTYEKRVPSARSLVDEFDLSLPTVQRAIRVLRDEGIVTTRVGRGTFVAKPKDDEGA